MGVQRARVLGHSWQWIRRRFAQPNSATDSAPQRAQAAMSALKAPKRLASQEGGPPTPAHPERQGRSCSALLHLPSDLLDVLLRELQWKELVALGAVCTQLRALAEVGGAAAGCSARLQAGQRPAGPAATRWASPLGVPPGSLALPRLKPPPLGAEQALSGA